MAKKLKLDLITTARSDFSIFKPIHEALARSESFDCRMVVTGTHFLAALGHTYREVHAELPAEERFDLKVSDRDDPDVYLPEMLRGYSQELERRQPKAVGFFSDRFELMPLLTAAIYRRVPIVHFFGGEVTTYCIDAQVRDAIGKAAHLHVVYHDDQKKKLLALGEEDWRIFVSGAEPLSRMDRLEGHGILEFLETKGIQVAPRGLVACCYHPPTLPPGTWKRELPQLMEALAAFPDYTYVWSGVSADPEGAEVRERILETIAGKTNHVFFDHLGRRRYHSLLAHAKFMVGNSSSGLYEASSFQLPAVNVGLRQAGRLHGENVVDTRAEKSSIMAAIREAAAMPRSVIRSPYENASYPDNIVRFLSGALLDSRLMVKRLPGVKFSLGVVPDYDD